MSRARTIRCGHFWRSTGIRDSAIEGVYLSHCERGTGRLWRPVLDRTPKQSFGYVASPDAIRVKGPDISSFIMSKEPLIGRGHSVCATFSRPARADGTLASGDRKAAGGEPKRTKGSTAQRR